MQSLRRFLLPVACNAILYLVVNGQTPSAPSMFIDRKGDADQTRVWCFVRPSAPKPDFAVSGWVRTGPYANRAFHVEHTSLRDILAFAFRSQAERIQWSNPLVDSLFDAEVVVPKENQKLLPSLVQSTMQAAFGISAQWETKETDVAILELDSTKSTPFSQSASSDSLLGRSETRTDHGVTQFTATAISPEGIATVLQRTFKVIVFNETHRKGRAPINLTWDQDDWGSLQESLAHLGLRLTKARRSTQVLVVRAATHELGGK